MKIAFFHELTSLSGARKMVDEYGKNLSSNHQVDLYYIDEIKDESVTQKFTNVYFTKFGSKQWSGKDWKLKLYKDTIELARLYMLHKKISRNINKQKYDVVFVHPSKFTQAPFLLRFINNCIYYSPETLRFVYDNSLKLVKNNNVLKNYYEITNRDVRKRIDKSNINKAKLILTNSIYSKKNIYNAYNLESTVCYPGVNPKIFKPSFSKKRYDVIYIGEKSYIDGYDLLSSALNSNINIVERSKDGKGISELQLVEKINSSKIVLALSVNEPFGLIPLEAMACELPVIAVNEGGYKETVVDGKTGFLIKRSPKELADKISLLLNNPKLAKQLGVNGRREVLKKWTWERSVNEFLKIINTKLR